MDTLPSNENRAEQEFQRPQRWAFTSPYAWFSMPRRKILREPLVSRTFSILLLLLLAGCAELGVTSTEVINAKLNQLSETNARPLQILYVGSVDGSGRLDGADTKALLNGIASQINVEFTLVGKNAEDARRLFRDDNFAVGYDAVVYNMCFRFSEEVTSVENVIAQTRDFGVGAVILPCAVQSFQDTSPFQNNPEWHAAALEDWYASFPNQAFPYWWSFAGVAVGTQEFPGRLSVEQIGASSLINLQMPKQFEAFGEPLTTTVSVEQDVSPLYAGVSHRTAESYPVAWTNDVGNGQVFSTTLGQTPAMATQVEYRTLLARGIAYVTDSLDDDGGLGAGLAGNVHVINYQDTTACAPSDVIDASTIGDVQYIVRRAVELDKALKVISVQRSNSDNGFVCPDQGGLLLNVWQMRNVIQLNHEAMTVTVQPGIRATDLSDYLHERGYAIRAMPDYTGVSIAGSIATGAHHSSLSVPAGMADMVTAITFVDGRGEIRRFEGDAVEQAAVHLGMLGVVVEVTLKIEPQFKLQYGFQTGSDEELEYTIEDQVRSHEYARVMWFAGNGRYVIDYYNRVPMDTPGNSRHNLWSATGAAFKLFGDIPYRVLNSSLLRAQCDSALMRSRFWVAPIRTIDSPRDRPVGFSHDMLGSVCEPGDCPWDRANVRSRTMEAAFPVHRLQEWMTDVRAILDARRACFPILGIYLRFLKVSDRWMAINYGEDMVAFEIHVPKIANEKRLEQSADVYDEIMQMTLYKYNGRPHWGKNRAPAFAHLGPSEYPRWNDFIQLKNGLDPTGLFENRMWRQMTGNEALKDYPGCVLGRDCICLEDVHCGEGYSCQMGDVYPQARVCRRK